MPADQPIPSALNVKIGRSPVISEWPILQVAIVSAAKGLPAPLQLNDEVRDNLVTALAEEDGGATACVNGFFLLKLGHIEEQHMIPEQFLQELRDENPPAGGGAGGNEENGAGRNDDGEHEDHQEPEKKKRRTKKREDASSSSSETSSDDSENENDDRGKGDAAFPRIPKEESKNLRRQRQYMLDFLQHEAGFTVVAMMERIEKLVTLAGQQGGKVFAFYEEAEKAFIDQRRCMSPETLRRAAIQYFGGAPVIRSATAKAFRRLKAYEATVTPPSQSRNRMSSGSSSHGSYKPKAQNKSICHHCKKPGHKKGECTVKCATGCARCRK